MEAVVTNAVIYNFVALITTVKMFIVKDPGKQLECWPMTNIFQDSLMFVVRQEGGAVYGGGRFLTLRVGA